MSLYSITNTQIYYFIVHNIIKYCICAFFLAFPREMYEIKKQKIVTDMWWIYIEWWHSKSFIGFSNLTWRACSVASVILNARQKEEGFSCRISFSKKGRAKVSYLQTNVQVVQLKPNHFGLNNSKSNLEDPILAKKIY